MVKGVRPEGHMTATVMSSLPVQHNSLVCHCAARSVSFTYTNMYVTVMPPVICVYYTWSVTRRRPVPHSSSLSGDQGSEVMGEGLETC